MTTSHVKPDVVSSLIPDERAAGRDGPELHVKPDMASLMVLYTENAETVRAFWEWRHKVITIYFAALGAVFIVVSWMIDHAELQQLLWLPFASGALFTWVVALMERTNRLVLRQCYSLGKGIEEQVRDGGGIFCRISIIANEPFIYSKVLRVLYPSTSFILLIAAVAAPLWRR